MMVEESAAAGEAPPSPCRNCGAPAPGEYCPACGQETRKRPPTFIQFMREAGGRYVALDGRLWKTLGGLLFRPGFLTREYFAGRRKRYIRPARLFLVASLLLFAALRIVVELQGIEMLQFDDDDKAATRAKDDGGGKNQGTGSADKTSKRAEADKAGEIDKRAERENLGGAAKRGGETSGIESDDDMNVVSMAANEFPTLKRRIERFNHLPNHEKGVQMLDGALRYGPYAMFVLLPAFGLLLKILYLGPRRRYPTRPRLYSEHLVFAAHNHAFLFLAIATAAAVPSGLLRTVVIVWMLVYMLASLRVVYRGSWIGIALRSFVMLIVYAMLFGFVTGGLLLVAVLLR